MLRNVVASVFRTCAGVVLMATAAWAQGVGVIAGQVVDPSEAALPGATVVATRTGPARARTVVTDNTGRFRIDQLPPGDYTVVISLAGFQAMTKEAVAVPAGQVTAVNATLAVAALAESVVVRGTARNYASAVAGKRMADGIVDMFAADEIGRLPDKNIGETLNRIPGVSMLLEKGEGRFVQIRGISPRLNNVTLNGLAMGNAETESGGRLMPLDVIGGELLAGVEVLKTPTSDMDGQGIGGTLNLTSKQPFDFDDRFTAFLSARSGFESVASISPDDTKEVPYTMDATLAGRAPGNRFAWLVGGSFSNRRTPLLGIFNDDWREVTLGNQAITIPTNVKNNVTVTARERKNVNAAIEARPDGMSRYFLRSFYAQWNELQLRNRFDEGLGAALTAILGPNSGTIASNRVQVNLRSEPTVKKMLSVNAGGERRMGAWNLDYVVQSTDNSVDEPNDNWEFRSGASTFGPDTFVIEDSGAVTISSPGRDRFDPTFQTFRRVRFFEQLSRDRATALGANLRRDFALGRNSVGFLKTGVKVTGSRRTTERSQDTYNIGSLNWTAAQAPSLTRGGFVNPVPLKDVPNLWLDADGLSAFFADNRTDTRYFRLDPAAQYVDEYQGDFTVKERVAAGYAMTKLDFGRASLIGGVRVEQTAVTSSAFTMVTESGRTIARPIDGRGSYTNVLPSVLATFTPRTDVTLRLGWNRSVGRPEFDAIAPTSVLTIVDDATVGTIGVLRIGNPDLKARNSNNVDASLEWYFAEGALASVALFRKDIRNEIIAAPTVRQQNYTFQGQAFDRFDTDTTINAEKADVTGVELSFSQALRFLPGPLDGLGVAGHLTVIGSGVQVTRGTEVLRLPLLQQAGQSRSLTAYYQRGRWDLSTTYKYNANFLTDYGESRALDLDQGSFGRVDLRAQFELTRDLNLVLSGINLNDEPTTEFQGGNPRQITEYEYTGRTFFIGFSTRVARR